MATHRWIAGDTDPVEVRLYDRGDLIPLDGADVVLRSRAVGGTTTEEVICEVVEGSTIRFLPPTSWNVPGVYRVQWPITFSPGTLAERRLTVPNGGDGDFWDTFEVGAAL